MKINNNNLNNLSYWVEIVEDSIRSGSQISVKNVVESFRKFVLERGDEEEVTEDALLKSYLVISLKYARGLREKAVKLVEEAEKKDEEIKKLEGFVKIGKADVNGLGSKISELEKLVEEWKQKYTSQVDVTAQRELEIEKMKGGEGFVRGPMFNQLQIVNDLQQFSIAPDQFPSLTQSIGTSDIANDEQLLTVKRAMKIDDVKVFSRTAFEFTISCGSRSTSDKDPYDGIIKIDGKSWSRSDIAYAIKSSGITVRQFCAAYANLYWNFNLMRGTPPENWRKKGFTESTKFAAFDFFYAVGSNAAIPTERNGRVKLIRPPTNEENEANSSMKYADIFEQSSRSAGHVTSSPFYNRGSSYESKSKVSLIEL